MAPVLPAEIPSSNSFAYRDGDIGEGGWGGHLL